MIISNDIACRRPENSTQLNSLPAAPPPPLCVYHLDVLFFLLITFVVVYFTFFFAVSVFVRSLAFNWFFFALLFLPLLCILYANNCIYFVFCYCCCCFVYLFACLFCCCILFIAIYCLHARLFDIVVVNGL